MNVLAEELNAKLEGTVGGFLLSDYGKRIYIPKGIVVQGLEAKAKSKRYNATIGVATEDGLPMYFPSMKKWFDESLTSAQVFGYAPMGGLPALREAWKEDMVFKNPDLKGKAFSLPVVCGGLTNGLSVVCSLFLDRGDCVVLPDKYWENYDLIIDEQCQAEKVFFPMFDGQGFNVRGLDERLASCKAEKAAVILNFPNNPTGYSPTVKEADEIACVLKKHADSGKKLIVITDDAYFGLFYEDNIYKQSVFAKLCDLSENILAVKCDAATKENMAWGFRVGFITYGFKGATPDALQALTDKTLGAIRGSVSSCSMPSQTILLKSLSDSEFHNEKQKGFEKMQCRYGALKEALEMHKTDTALIPLPFNSGYFMSFRSKCPAEALRQHLLEKYGTGIIRMEEHVIRLAFSGVDAKDIGGLTDVVYKAASDLMK